MALSHGGMRAATHPLSSTQNRASVLPASFLDGPGKPMGGGLPVAGRGHFVPFWAGMEMELVGEKERIGGNVESYCEIIKFSYYEAIMLIYYIYMLFIFK